jgi:Protein of unknown function (DUF3326)
MEISNIVFQVARAGELSWLTAVSREMAAALGSNVYPLRLSIVEAGDGEATVEATIIRFDSRERHARTLRNVEIFEPRRRSLQVRPFVAAQIIPTGVKCEFGGFAGDASPVTNLLASAVDQLVTHPNAVNASDLNEMAGNVLYVEGKSLDDFFLGHVALSIVVANKIGTFFDPTGIAYVDDLINTLNAARAVKGIDCGLHTVLPRGPGVQVEWSDAGCAVGTVLEPEIVLDAVELLVAHGAQAIGGISVIDGVTSAMFARHLDGKAPNPSGGAEAILTHLISKVFRLPTAHAPLPYYQDLKGKDTRNPRSAAEFISTPHYFSVLKGLAQAPRLVALDQLSQVPSSVISVNNVHAIVVPASCLGGVPALAAEFHDIPLIAVRENTTILDVTNAKMAMRNVIEVDSYLEAAGVLLTLREGISLESVCRPLGDAVRVGAPREAAEATPAARVPGTQDHHRQAVGAVATGQSDGLRLRRGAR